LLSTKICFQIVPEINYAWKLGTGWKPMMAARVVYVKEGLVALIDLVIGSKDCASGRAGNLWSTAH
jgi:hypothetical protein